MLNIMEKKGGGPSYYGYIASYLCTSYEGPSTSVNFQGEGTWPISFVAQVGTIRYSYTPRSDFVFVLKGSPFLFIEVCSDRDRELDRYRMLLQAGLLVRVMNSSGFSNSFMAIAIYINSKFTAERYLVYHDSNSIKYVHDDFDLSTPLDAFRFFYELHNLPSVLPTDYMNASGHFHTLQTTVKNQILKGYTSRTTHASRKRKRTDSGSGSGGASGNSPIHNPSTVHHLLNAGYEVLQEEEDPESGWILLNPLKPTLSRAKRSTGEIVMLKLVQSDELKIHSFLNNIKSEHNHTISILDEVILDVEKIIAMPNEWVFPEVPLSVFETSGDDLANQFLEGVQFMHKNKVAHLDLKPDNILVTRTTRPLRLLIIDFSVSVHVDTEESD